MAYKDTAVTRGSGVGLVVSTGMETELGRISKLVAEAEQAITPLERRLDRLGRRLIWLTLAIAVLVVGGGFVAGKDLLVMVETAIALAIAVVPEGLPVVATLALAQGMRRMARRNAAADMVFKDDAFATILVAIEHGRTTSTISAVSSSICCPATSPRFWRSPQRGGVMQRPSRDAGETILLAAIGRQSAATAY